MQVTIESGVDPKDLLINKRYTDTRKIPPDVQKAIKQLVKDTEDAKNVLGLEFPKDPKVRLSMEFVFTFNDKKADLDGPHKRVQDAVAAGLNVNDNRVDYYSAERVTDPSNVGIKVTVATLEDIEGEKIESEDPWSITVGDTYVDLRSGS